MTRTKAAPYITIKAADFEKYTIYSNGAHGSLNHIGELGLSFGSLEVRNNRDKVIGTIKDIIIDTRECSECTIVKVILNKP
jgi:hypothetical protein